MQDIRVYRANISNCYKHKRKQALTPFVKEAMDSLGKDIDVQRTKEFIKDLLSPMSYKEAQDGWFSSMGKLTDYAASLLLFGPLVLGIPAGYLLDRLTTPSKSDIERRQHSILKTEYEEAIVNLQDKLKERKKRRQIKGLDASPNKFELAKEIRIS